MPSNGRSELLKYILKLQFSLSPALGPSRERSHIPGLEKENHLQYCFSRGYVSSQEGIPWLRKKFISSGSVRNLPGLNIIIRGHLCWKKTHVSIYSWGFWVLDLSGYNLLLKRKASCWLRSKPSTDGKPLKMVCHPGKTVAKKIAMVTLATLHELGAFFGLFKYNSWN